MPKPNPLSQGLKQQQARQAEFADAPVPVTALPSPGAPGRPRHRVLDRPAAFVEGVKSLQRRAAPVLATWRHNDVYTCRNEAVYTGLHRPSCPLWRCPRED
jgi:hypothetical protein